MKFNAIKRQNIQEILVLDFTPKYQNELGRTLKKFDLNIKHKSGLMISELAGLINYKRQKEPTPFGGHSKKDKETSKKELLEFIVEIDDISLNKYYQHYSTLDKSKINPEITCYEYYIFENFNKYYSHQLLDILSFLAYDHSLSIIELFE